MARSLLALVALLLACDPAPDPSAHCELGEADECALDVGGRVPATFTGATSELEDGTFSGSRCGVGGGLALDDAAFRWTAPRAGRFRFSTEGSAFDTVLSVRRASCGGTELVCNDDAALDVTHSVVELDLDECESIVLIVDGHDGASSGAFSLSVTVSEGSCEDGLDGDGDGLVDCDDPDCASPRCDVVIGEWPEQWIAFEAGVLEAVNQRRAEGATCDGEPFGPVPALEREVTLETSARLHSLDMAEQRYFDHTSIDGRVLTDRVAAAGYSGASPVGENIAMGYGTVADVMNGWMTSPGHCRNIMSPSYRVMGVGYAEVEGGDGPRWTQNFGGSH